jgi:hypothetical protein
LVIKVPGEIAAAGVPFGQQGGHPFGEEVGEGGSLLEHRSPHDGAVLEQVKRVTGELRLS